MMTSSRSNFVCLTMNDDGREKKISMIFSFRSSAKTSVLCKEISGLFTRVYVNSHFHRAFFLFLKFAKHRTMISVYLRNQYAYQYFSVNLYGNIIIPPTPSNVSHLISSISHATNLVVKRCMIQDY